MDSISDLIVRLETVLGTLPHPAASSVRARVQELREVLVDHRKPRIALVGRRGSGKSSLINALFGRPVVEVGSVKSQSGHARWFTYESELGALEVLDTRGIQEASAPTEADAAATPFDSIMAALATTPPDAVLFLCKAKEVDAALAGDLDVLKRILAEVYRRYKFRPPLLGVMTQADELDPPKVALPPEDDEEADLAELKLANVEKAAKHLYSLIEADPALRPLLVGVVSVAAFMSFRSDGSIRKDHRWNLDELVSVLFREMPRQARTELARLSQVKAVQRQLANYLVKTFTAVAMGIAITPLPFADLPALTGAQVAMVSSIGYVGGRELQARTAIELFSALGVNVGAAFGFRELARSVIKVLFPGGGSAISAAVAGSGTWALGQGAIAYFIERRNAVEARETYEAQKQVGPPKDTVL